MRNGQLVIFSLQLELEGANVRSLPDSSNAELGLGRLGSVDGNISNQLDVTADLVVVVNSQNGVITKLGVVVVTEEGELRGGVLETQVPLGEGSLTTNLVFNVSSNGVLVSNGGREGGIGRDVSLLSLHGVGNLGGGSSLLVLVLDGSLDGGLLVLLGGITVEGELDTLGKLVLKNNLS